MFRVRMYDGPRRRTSEVLPILVDCLVTFYGSGHAPTLQPQLARAGAQIYALSDHRTAVVCELVVRGGLTSVMLPVRRPGQQRAQDRRGGSRLHRARYGTVLPRPIHN
jgi:ABC-type amino acid transport system permease subunit